MTLSTLALIKPTIHKVQFPIGVDVPSGATISGVAYPGATAAGNFIGANAGPDCIAIVNNNDVYKQSRGQIVVSFGATISVVNASGATWPAGSNIRLELDAVNVLGPISAPVAPAAPLISLPAALGLPWAIYSVIKPAGYSGPCLRVQRASDNAQLDIGYTANNIVDAAAADAFANGSQLKVVVLYDVKPNEVTQAERHDLSQPVFLNAPEFTAQDLYQGIRPVMLAGFAGTTPQEWLQRTLTGDVSQLAMNAFTVYQLVAPTTSTNGNVFFEFAATPVLSGANAYTAYIGGAGPGPTPFGINIAGQNSNLSVLGRSQLELWGISSGATQTARCNGVEATATPAVTAANAPLLVVGASKFGASFNATMDLFSMVVYSQTHSSAQMQTVEPVLNGLVPMPGPLFNNKIVMAGTSIQRAIHCANKQTELTLAGLNGDPDGPFPTWEAHNIGVPSQTMAACYGTAGAPTPQLTFSVGLVNPAYRNNVYIFCDPINDLITAAAFANAAAATAAMDGFWTNLFLPALAAFQAQPLWNVLLVPTMIADGAFDTTTNFRETARLYWNAKVKANAGPLGYSVYDRADGPLTNSPAVARLGAPNFFGDFLHPLFPIYQILGARLAKLISALPTV